MKAAWYATFPCLHQAAITGNVDELNRLLKDGASGHSPDAAGRTALHLAALGDDIAMVQSLLQHGANPLAKSVADVTPLHEAAWRGNGEIAALLVNAVLKTDGTIDPVNSAGQTPLHWAALKGRQAVTLLLLRNGANASARDNHGQTPYSLAADYRHSTLITLLQPA